MRKVRIVAGTLLAGLLLSLVSLVPAQAATQYDFYHLKVSERANMLVFTSWNCKGGGYDFVREGEWAEVDVRSVWVPRGYSLWSFNSNAKGQRVGRSKDKAWCYSFRGYPGTHFLAAFAKGQKFSWME